MNAVNQHGGNLDAIQKIYGIPRDEIIDFSGNINPLGVPESVKKAIRDNVEQVCTYPDVNYEGLRVSISSYTGIDADDIIVGNGSTELISLFIKALEPKRSIIVSPAYSEYERELKLAKSSIDLFPLKEEDDFRLNISALKRETVQKNAELVVICNPNNPTGSFLTMEEIEELLIFLKKSGTYLMIDETYVEFSDTVVCAMPLVNKYDNIFIVRGTSKFFASPGLRLGYCACSNEKLKRAVFSKKDPWSVNMLANLAGIVMFKDRDYINKSHELISRERQRFINSLSALESLKLYDTQSNFILAKITDSSITSSEVFDILIKDKIVIRDASDFPYLGNRFLRFCILSSEHNDLLISKLKNIF